MIECKDFFKLLKKNNIDFYTGVPDSLLKNICAYITDNTNKEEHVISSSEGSSIGLAIGYNLSTGKIPLVYMQNSGLGNIINPILSLADSDVYKIPILLLIGWRGEPGVKDEPQHVKQGKITIDLLETMQIPYMILPDNIIEAENCLDSLILDAKNNSSVCALIVKKDTFHSYSIKSNISTSFEMNREQAIEIILSQLSSDDIVISTTGKASREVFEYRKRNNQPHDNDFLTVGGMGHANQIALGIAMQRSNKRVVCIDGDGAALMHLGSLGIIGDIAPPNFIHILINNGAHDSVGGQPTIGFDIDFFKLSKNLNYKSSIKIKSKKNLRESIDNISNIIGPHLIEVVTNKGARKNLGRPTISPLDNKIDFMKKINRNF